LRECGDRSICNCIPNEFLITVLLTEQGLIAAAQEVRIARMKKSEPYSSECEIYDSPSALLPLIEADQKAKIRFPYI